MACSSLSLSFNVTSSLVYVPSFPTRRSSDLLRTALPALHRAGVQGWPEHGRVPPDHVRRRGGPRRARARIHVRRRERSEEHTSELQSPDHLVCRLLLEKKKSRALCADSRTAI